MTRRYCAITGETTIPNYCIENVTNPGLHAHDPKFPGTFVGNYPDPISASKAYIASYSPAVGDVLSVHDVSQIFWVSIVTQGNTAAGIPAPANPAVGG